jgi:hypothetical protein
MLTSDGHADGPLDDVEVLLRGFLTAETFDRVIGAAGPAVPLRLGI